MRTTVNLDDELLAKASEAMGITDRSVLLQQGLKLIVQREAARRLSLLGGSDPTATAAPRHRAAPLNRSAAAPFAAPSKGKSAPVVKARPGQSSHPTMLR